MGIGLMTSRRDPSQGNNIREDPGTCAFINQWDNGAVLPPEGYFGSWTSEFHFLLISAFKFPRH